MPTPKPPTKAFGYGRVSSNAQLEGDGPDRQRLAVESYARKNNLEIVGWYFDSYTGTTDDRPQLNKMIYDIKEENGVYTVVIEKLDRLARDIMVQEFIIRDFQRLGINLISTQEGPDLATDDKTREFIRVIFGAAAQYEKKSLVERLRAARRRKKKVAYGHASGPLPHYSPELKAKIRNLQKQGLSAYKIAKLFNDEGIPTASQAKNPKKGARWSGQLVRAVAQKDYPTKKREKDEVGSPGTPTSTTRRKRKKK